MGSQPFSEGPKLPASGKTEVMLSLNTRMKAPGLAWPGLLVLRVLNLGLRKAHSLQAALSSFPKGHLQTQGWCQALKQLYALLKEAGPWGHQTCSWTNRE